MIVDHAALEEIEFDAIVDLYRAAPESVCAEHDVRVHSIGGTHCLTCRGIEPALIFRRVVGLGVRHAVTPAQLEEVLGYMDGLGLRYAIPVVPQAQPPALASWLEARGFSTAYAWMKFMRSCEPTSDAGSDLEIEVIDQARAGDFGHVVTQGFGLPSDVGAWIGAVAGRPNWVCVLGLADGQAAAAAAAYVRGEYAWLGLAATLPAYRRRGGQSTLLARRLAEAHARGARFAVTETGERLPDKPSNSYRNILRAGFKEMYLRQNYLSPSK